MVEQGGYRKPSQPAPVSGPGALSRRTDGGAGQPVRPVTGLPYGENQALNEIQGAAPMAAASANNSMPASAASDVPAPTPLLAGTERPSEPLTEGNPMGAGSDDSVLSKGSFRKESSQDLAAIKERWLPSLMRTAQGDNIPPSFVRFVRAVRDMN